MTDWRITLADVVIGEEERQAVDEVLRSGWLSMGPRTEQFEAALAATLGTAEAIAVTNGTAALHLAAAALGLGPGDEVIVPALTFVASAAGIRHTGASVTLGDSLSVDDFALDPAEIDRLAGPRTRAVVILHYGGYPADTDALLAAAERHGLLVIEDAAHAIGASIGGRACGTIGDAGCFSFFPNKNMTTGEGGAVVFRSEQVAERARSLRSHAMTTLTWDRHRGHASSYADRRAPRCAGLRAARSAGGSERRPRPRDRPVPRTSRRQRAALLSRSGGPRRFGASPRRRGGGLGTAPRRVANGAARGADPVKRALPGHESLQCLRRLAGDRSASGANCRSDADVTAPPEPHRP